jgi:hypothetical protein
MPLDPITTVGLIASASQLAGQALSIVLNLRNYKEAIKKGPKHSAELRQEMATLWNLLESLDDAISNNTQFTWSASLKTSCQELESMLDEMNNRVKPSKTAGLNRLKWPFTMDENKRLLSRISRYKEIPNVTLNTQTVYFNLPVCLLVRRSNTAIILNHTTNIQCQIEIEKREKILEWLSPGSFTTKHEQLRKTRVEGTGQWFLDSDEFRHWVNGAAPQTLLCPGIRINSPKLISDVTVAGAGKSFLM